MSRYGPLDGYRVTIYEEGDAKGQEDNKNTTSYTYRNMMDNRAYRVCVEAYNIREQAKLYSPQTCIERGTYRDSE